MLKGKANLIMAGLLQAWAFCCLWAFVVAIFSHKIHHTMCARALLEP